MQTKRLEQLPFEMQFEILRRLSSKDLLNICSLRVEGRYALAICSDDWLWYNIIRSRYGEDMFRRVRDVSPEISAIHKFRQIVDLDESNDVAVIYTCDSIRDPIVQAICESRLFKFRQIRAMKSFREVIETEDVEALEAYIDLGPPNSDILFNPEDINENPLLLVLSNHIEHNIPLQYNFFRMLVMDSPLDLEHINSQTRDYLVEQSYIQGKEFFELFQQKGLVSIDSRNDIGQTPLMIVAGTTPEIPEYVRWLIKEGSDVNAVDYDGDTPLNYALGNDNEENAQILLETPFINVNVINNIGESSFDIALTHNANPYIIRSLLRKTPLDASLLSKTRDPVVLETLLEEFGFRDPRYKKYLDNRYMEAVLKHEFEIQEILKPYNPTFALGNYSEELLNDIVQEIIEDEDEELMNIVLNDETLNPVLREEYEERWEERQSFEGLIGETEPIIPLFPAEEINLETSSLMTIEDVNILNDALRTRRRSQEEINQRYSIAYLKAAAYGDERDINIRDFLREEYDAEFALGDLDRFESRDLIYGPITRLIRNEDEETINMIINDETLSLETHAHFQNEIEEILGAFFSESSEEELSEGPSFFEREHEPLTNIYNVDNLQEAIETGNYSQEEVNQRYALALLAAANFESYEQEEETNIRDFLRDEYNAEFAIGTLNDFDTMALGVLVQRLIGRGENEIVNMVIQDETLSPSLRERYQEAMINQSSSSSE